MAFLDWFRRRKSPVIDEGDRVVFMPPDQYFARADVWRYVSSSNVEAIAHYQVGGGNPNLGSPLRVRFKNGSEYEYAGVSRDTYELFLGAPSKGRFVWTDLRGQYSYRRVK